MTDEPIQHIEVLACQTVRDSPEAPDPRTADKSPCARCRTAIWTGARGRRWVSAKPGRHMLCIDCVQQLADDVNCAQLQMNPPLDSQH